MLIIPSPTALIFIEVLELQGRSIFVSFKTNVSFGLLGIGQHRDKYGEYIGWREDSIFDQAK